MASRSAASCNKMQRTCWLGHGRQRCAAAAMMWGCVQEEVIPTCRELGIGIVAFSPLGRGFLTGTIDDLKNLRC